jgi:protein phosphatase
MSDILRGNAGIRLAGATNDVHMLDVRTGTWEKISPLGEPPSPRAAHAAAAVGTMVVIQVCFPLCIVDKEG